MEAKTFWKLVVEDRADFLDRLVGLLAEHGIRWCLIGGQGVNAYVDPVISLDLDLVIAAEQIPLVEELLRREFRVERFPHSLNVSVPGSRMRVQIQTDPRYLAFVDRATVRDVLDMPLPVAALEDILQALASAALDSDRAASRRMKDLADIARLLEACSHLRERVPTEVLERLCAAGIL